MRYLADWNEVKQNMAKSRTTEGNLTIGWFVTLSNLNVYYLPEIIEEFYKEYSDFGCFLNLVHAPKYFNISIMPDDIKKIVIDRLNTIPKAHTHMWRQLPGIIGFIENGTPDPAMWSKFLQEIKLHDNYRKQNYADVFPEFAEIIGYRNDRFLDNS
jgi:hypothetical protein